MIFSIVEKSDTSGSNKKTGRQYNFWLWAMVAFTLLLASGLPRLTLKEGVNYGDDWLQETVVGDINFLPYIIFGVAILSFLFLIHVKQNHWRYFWPTVLLAGLLLGSGAALIALLDPIVELEITPTPEAVVDGEEELAEFVDPQLDPGVVVIEEFVPPPPWVTYLVSVLLAFAMLLVLAGLYMVYTMVTPQPAENDETPLIEVVQQARTAIDALRRGEPLGDVVLRCYADMEQTLRTTRGIERRQTMTAREFEQHLVQLSLPAEAVKTLTRLFESVRYSPYVPSADDQTTAIDSLTQIVAASGQE